MTEQGPDADAPALVLRPLGWREADGVARLWRDLLVMFLPLLPFAVLAGLFGEHHPAVLVLVLVCVLLILVIYVVELVLVRRERVVVSAGSVEWWRGKRLRARLRRGPTLRAARYVPWPVGRPLGLLHLAVSDGTTGFRLGDARWIAHFETIAHAAEVAAPRLTHDRARRRMPECFTPVERLADLVGSRRRRVVVLLAVLALGGAAFVAGLMSGGV
ncbi:MAG: hypothetical protein PGN15_07505 [Aeromicrobium erythreum]